MDTEKVATKKRTVKRVKAKADGSLKVADHKPTEASPNVGNAKPDEKPKKKKKAKKPATPAEWLATYTKEGEMTTSGAKLATYLMSRKQGADIHETIQRCTQIAELKSSNWGKSSSSIKGHLRFLKQKGLQIEELKKDVFKVSA